MHNLVISFDFEKISSFTFQKPDIEKFPSLRLVEEVLQEKPSAALIFNSANEVAVEAFLKEKIRIKNHFSRFTHSLIVKLPLCLFAVGQKGDHLALGRSRNELERHQM